MNSSCQLTPLAMAAKEGQLEMIQILMETGNGSCWAEASKKSEGGSDPLMQDVVVNSLAHFQETHIRMCWDYFD